LSTFDYNPEPTIHTTGGNSETVGSRLKDVCWTRNYFTVWVPHLEPWIPVHVIISNNSSSLQNRVVRTNQSAKKHFECAQKRLREQLFAATQESETRSDKRAFIHS
jgi:hypothetical protein